MRVTSLWNNVFYEFTYLSQSRQIRIACIKLLFSSAFEAIFTYKNKLTRAISSRPCDCFSFHFAPSWDLSSFVSTTDVDVVNPSCRSTFMAMLWLKSLLWPKLRYPENHLRTLNVTICWVMCMSDSISVEMSGLAVAYLFHIYLYYKLRYQKCQACPCTREYLKILSAITLKRSTQKPVSVICVSVIGLNCVTRHSTP